MTEKVFKILKGESMSKTSLLINKLFKVDCKTTLAQITTLQRKYTEKCF